MKSFYSILIVVGIISLMSGSVFAIECPDGKYPNPTDDACLDCDAACATCTEAPKCTSCKDPLQWLNPATGLCDAAKAVCEDGTYYVELDNTCAACDGACDTCTEATKCTACKDVNKWLNPATGLCDADKLTCEPK